jgi:amidase
MHNLQLNIRRETLRAEYLAHYNAQNVDVILCPAGAGPAPALGTCKYWGYAMHTSPLAFQPIVFTRYTNVWNFLDYPAAVFPTGLYVEPEADVADAPRAYMSDADAHNSDSCERSSCLITRCGVADVLVCVMRRTNYV